MMITMIKKRKKHITKTTTEHGFTLIEMALVLAILGVVGVLYLQAGIAVSDQKNVNLAIKEMENIQLSIRDFVVRTHRLPCPSDFDDVYGQAKYGEEEKTTSSTTVECTVDSEGTNNDPWGYPPFRAFGLLESDVTDPWGTRYMYIINLDAAGYSVDNGDSFASPCNDGNYVAGADDNICNGYSLGGLDFRKVPYGGGKFVDMLDNYSIIVENLDSPATELTNRIAYALVSAGPNREFEQKNNDKAVTLDEKCYLQSSCPASDVFDDIVVYIPIVSLLKSTNHMPVDIDYE